MKEITGNLWAQKEASAICITTNAFIKKDGTLVMGRGCAKEASDRYPGLSKHAGSLIKANGNHVFKIHTVITNYIDEASGYNTQDMLTFPVKKYWWDKADLDLIAQSCRELVAITNEKKYTSVVLPRPGCGNGGRNWEKEVKPIVSKLLDDRFQVITNI